MKIIWNAFTWTYTFQEIVRHKYLEKYLACQRAKNGNFPPHDGVSERLWTAINLGEIPTRNYKAAEHRETLKRSTLEKT